MSLHTNPLLTQAPAVLNIGIDGFNDSIATNGGQVANVAWQPPGNADPKLAWNLARLMGDARITAANEEVTRRIINARPMWEDIALRADGVFPELKGSRLLLHAGPSARCCTKAGRARQSRRKPCWNAVKSHSPNAMISKPWGR